MKRKPIKNLIKSPEVIPGIYNYCDSWCERCAFTQRCVNYSMRQSVEDGTYEKEMDELMDTFEDPFDKFADEIPGPEIDYTSEDSRDEELFREPEIEKDDCAVVSLAYADTVTKWFNDNSESIGNRNLEFQKANNQEVLNKLKDDIDIITWYQYQINIKIMRSLHGLVDDLLDEPDGYPKDYDGSAKVALIGIDNSTAAWKDLLKLFPEKEDINDIVLMLEQLTKMVEKSFPNARSFIRPGFDETQN